MMAILFGFPIPLAFALLPESFLQSFSLDTKFYNVIIGIFGFSILELAFFTDLSL